MAKRNKAKFASKSRKSALRVEALEQRQLLAAVTGAGTEVGSNIQHPNGNVYDQVLMTGTSVTVTADWELNQITRVSFLDESGDIIQAEFSGKGTMTISLENFVAAAEPTQYNQDVAYVSGLATFTIQGSDATTNFNVFSVGTANAFLGADNPIFEGGLDGGNNIANVAALRIVADPQNPGGFSTFGRIGAGNAVFAANTGTVGIAAANVNVQGPVIIGDIDASDTGVPTLNFGVDSQFSTLIVAGGDLDQTNGAAFVDTAGSFQTINATAGTTSGGATLGSQVIDAAALATIAGVDAATLDSTTEIDLTGLTQAQIDDLFEGRTFTQDLTITGDLSAVFDIDVAEFRGSVTIAGDILGDLTVAGDSGAINITGNVEGDIEVEGALDAVSVTGDIEGLISAESIGGVTLVGDLSGLITTDTNDSDDFDDGEGAIGDVAVTGNITGSGAIEGVLGIGDITVSGDVDSDAAGEDAVFSTHSGDDGDAFLANIGTLTIDGDVNTGTAVGLINITGNGSFGNVEIKGGGDTDSAIGFIDVGGSLGTDDTVTGTITITETSDVSWAGLGVASEIGATGAVTITGADDATFTLDDFISVVDADAGDITVSGFLNIAIDAAIDANGAAITLTTAEEDEATIEITADGSIGTAVDTGAITLTADAADSLIEINGAIGDETNLGAILINAGSDGSEVVFTADISGDDIGGVTITAETITMDDAGIVSAGNAGDITLLGEVTVGGDSIALDSAGDISIDGDATFAAADSLVVGELDNLVISGDTSITGVLSIDLGEVSGDVSFEGGVDLAAAATANLGDVGGDVTIGGDADLAAAAVLGIGDVGGSVTIGGDTTLVADAATAINVGDVDGDVTFEGETSVLAGASINVGEVTGGVSFEDVTTLEAGSTVNADGIGTLTLTDATFEDGAQVLIAGSVGALVLDGVTDLSANTADSFVLDNEDDSLDTLGAVTINGQVLGGAGTEIVASSVGDITATASLNLTTKVLLTDFNVYAGQMTEEVLDSDGSNLADYTIGDIEVTDTGTLGFSGTALFGGDSSFDAIGGVGDVSLTGGGTENKQTALFVGGAGTLRVTAGVFGSLDNAESATFDGGFDFDGNGTIGTEVDVDDVDDDDDVDETVASAEELASDFDDDSEAEASVGAISIDAKAVDVGAGNVDSIEGAVGVSILASVDAGDETAAALDADLAGVIGNIMVLNNSQVLSMYNGAGVEIDEAADVDAGTGVFNGGFIIGTAVGTVQTLDLDLESGDGLTIGNDATGAEQDADAGDIVVIVV